MHAFLAMNACKVWDFDDDNCLSDETRALLSSSPTPSVWLTSELSVTNPYLLFGPPDYIWPRGLPVQYLSHQEFPRLVQYYEGGGVDVIQVLQTLHPDVDALWRIQHGQEPMFWTQSLALDGQLIGIHPSRMAPFNAQATLLSRRALSLAFLPATVHGRVSDIWRSYIMQYLLAPHGAHVAFSGASVHHHRNPHNTMADFHAEMPLYMQSLALVTYLQSRPHCHDNDNCTLYEAFVSLIDDLYTRKFLESADVHAAVAWAKRMLVTGPTVAESIPGPPQLPFASPVVAVLHINHCHREVIPLWMALHRHKFLAVEVYTPGCTPCQPISGVTRHCLSEDRGGYLAYESMLHTMQRAAEWPQAEGFVFLHDDVVMSRDLKWGSSSSRYIGRCPLAVVAGGDLACYHLVGGDDPNWLWLSRPVGLQALDRFKQRLDSGEAFDPMQGQGDVFYVGTSDVATFMRVGHLMLQSDLFLEIAVPTLLASFAASAEPLTLYTLWTGERDKTASIMHGMHNTHALLAHPVKLRDMEAIMAHLS